MTISKQNCKMIRGDTMIDFIKQDFVIEKIELACMVAEGKAAPIHKNRKNHGLAFFRDGETILNFENKRIKAVKNSLVYFPKGSDYTVRETAPSVCYAINFQMKTEREFEPFSVQLKTRTRICKALRKVRGFGRRNPPDILPRSSPSFTIFSIICRPNGSFPTPIPR